MGKRTKAKEEVKNVDKGKSWHRRGQAWLELAPSHLNHLRAHGYIVYLFSTIRIKIFEWEYVPLLDPTGSREGQRGRWRRDEQIMYEVSRKVIMKMSYFFYKEEKTSQIILSVFSHFFYCFCFTKKCGTWFCIQKIDEMPNFR